MESPVTRVAQKRVQMSNWLVNENTYVSTEVRYGNLRSCLLRSPRHRTNNTIKQHSTSKSSKVRYKGTRSYKRINGMIVSIVHTKCLYRVEGTRSGSGDSAISAEHFARVDLLKLGYRHWDKYCLTSCCSWFYKTL